MNYKGFVCEASPIFSLGSYRTEYCIKTDIHRRSISLNSCCLSMYFLFEPICIFNVFWWHHQIMKIAKALHVLCKLLRMPPLFDFRRPFSLVVRGCANILTLITLLFQSVFFSYFYINSITLFGQQPRTFCSNCFQCKILCFKCKKNNKWKWKKNQQKISKTNKKSLVVNLCEKIVWYSLCVLHHNKYDVDIFFPLKQH